MKVWRKEGAVVQTYRVYTSDTADQACGTCLGQRDGCSVGLVL